MNNTISVIVPAFNIEAYLPRCLDGILSQTYENLEIIVVNDGSRDNTAGVIDSYAARDSRMVWGTPSIINTAPSVTGWLRRSSVIL